MKWLIDTFYLHPLPVLLLTIAIYVSVIIWYCGKGAEQKKSEYPTELRPASLSQFLQYFNNSRQAYLHCGFDGSKCGMPLVEGIFTGPYQAFTVSVFQFVLPTGRAGTWQTVVHIRSAKETLPVVSIKDPTYIPKLSDLLKQKAEFRFRDSFFESEYEDYQPPGAKDILRNLKDVEGLVVDASGNDLLYYVSGKIAEPVEWDNLINRGISLFKMIKSGCVDISLIEVSEAENSYAFYIRAKHMLLSLPGLVMIVLVGYGSKIFSIILVVGFLLLFVFAKGRYYKYRDIYPVKMRKLELP